MLLKVERTDSKAGINLALLALQIPVFISPFEVLKRWILSWDPVYRKSTKGISTCTNSENSAKQDVETTPAHAFSYNQISRVFSTNFASKTGKKQAANFRLCDTMQYQNLSKNQRYP